VGIKEELYLKHNRNVSVDQNTKHPSLTIFVTKMHYPKLFYEYVDLLSTLAIYMFLP